MSFVKDYKMYKQATVDDDRADIRRITTDLIGLS